MFLVPAVKKHIFYYKLVFIAIVTCCTSGIVSSLEVGSYYGNYDIATKKPWRPATSLTGPNIETWAEPIAVNKPYKIGVLVPHVQDSYWLAVNYGLIKEAEKLGITVKLFSAGGYSKGGIQRKQLTDDILKEKVNGVILASIFYDKLDHFIAQVDKMEIPIVSMINDVLSPNVKAGVTVSYYEVGYKLGEFVLDDAAGKDFKVAFFPGPKSAVWATDTYAGFLAAVNENTKAKPVGKITIVALQYDILDGKQQQLLVDKVLALKPNINYIIGNAIAAKEASILVSNKYKAAQPAVKIISTYLTPDIYDMVKTKNIYGTVVDFNIEQARMALHLMVRYLNGEQPNKQETKFPFRTAPLFKIVTSTNIDNYKPENLFANKNFKPTYEFVAPAKVEK